MYSWYHIVLLHGDDFGIGTSISADVGASAGAGASFSTDIEVGLILFMVLVKAMRFMYVAFYTITFNSSFFHSFGARFRIRV